MLKSGKFVAGIGVAIFCLALVVATFAFAATPVQPAAQAAPAAQATPVPGPTTAPAKLDVNPAKPDVNSAKPGNVKSKDGGIDEAQFQAAFSKAFAAKLGVSEEAMNSAYVAAVSETVDQMVKDGKVSPEAAAKIKEVAKQGPGPLSSMGGMDKPGASVNGPIGDPKELIRGALPQVAALFNLSLDDLTAKMNGGQTLADLAAAAKVDLQKVKDTILASFKTQIDALVTAGKLTQTEADNVLKKLTPFVDEFVTAKPGDKVAGDIYGSLLGDTTTQAAAQLLNLPVKTLQEQVKGGQTILALAKAQNVDETKLRDGLQASMKSQLDELVKNGKVTQADADKVSKDLPNLVSKYIGGEPDQK